MDYKPGGESAAHNFLWKLIPMFCMTLFQDGIYWIEEKPTHPISLFLTGLLPGWYTEYARQERDRIAQLDFAERDEHINRLAPQCKAAFDCTNEFMQAKFEQLEERERQREHRERLREQTLQLVLEQLVQLRQSSGQQRTTATDVVTPTAAAAATVRHGELLPQRELVVATSPPRPPPPPPLGQQIAAAGAGTVGVQTPMNPYADMPELPKPNFSTMNRALSKRPCSEYDF
jgi:hypothetical protein